MNTCENLVRKTGKVMMYPCGNPPAFFDKWVVMWSDAKKADKKDLCGLCFEELRRVGRVVGAEKTL